MPNTNLEEAEEPCTNLVDSSECDVDEDEDEAEDKDVWEDPLATEMPEVLRGGLNFFRVPPRPAPGRFFSGRLSILPWSESAARPLEEDARPAALETVRQ